MQKKILIIDDSEETRELVKFTLETEGYKVVEAVDGVNGLRKVQLEPFDLIILDFSMPGLDGFSLTEKIRQSLYAKNVPILVATAHSKIKELFQSKGTTNIQDFLEKPFLPEELIKKVKKLLSDEDK
jgi:two-component system chemotaxis response regulator CheY